MEEEYREVKYRFYSKGQYPELKELHNIFAFVDGLLASGADYELEDPSPDFDVMSESTPPQKKRSSPT